MKHVNETGSQHVVIQDLKGAFDFVPIQRLLQIIQKRIPCAQTVDLIRLILIYQEWLLAIDLTAYWRNIVSLQRGYLWDVFLH